MDSLEGRFKAYDSSRRKDAGDEFRLSEVKAKLLFSAERKLYPHLLKIAGAKILSTKIDRLEVAEDVDSGSPVFSGKVLAEVSFLDGKQQKIATVPMPILKSEPTIVLADLRTALENASAVAGPVSVSTSTTITASLSDFKVVDDGTRYLKIYHTAAYGDLEPIGAVSKDEYVTSSDKGSLLAEMLKDEAVAWPADVTFVGEFAEPAIVEKIAKENLQYVTKAAAETKCKCGKAVACKGCEACLDHCDCPDMDKEASAWKYKIADTTRFTIEAQEKNYNDITVRLMQRAVSAFNDAWKARGTGTARITNTTANWDQASGVGEIKIEAEVLDGKDTKLVPFSVGINGSSMRLPDFTNLASLLKEAKVVNKVIQGENIYKNIDLAPGVAKTATPMAPTNTGYQEVLRMPKDFLPQSLKVGDVIEVDGLRWRLSSKSENQLSNIKDTSSHWLFERVRTVDNYTAKPTYKQQSY